MSYLNTGLSALKFHAVELQTTRLSTLVLTKNSPWQKILNKGLQKVRQSGQLDKLYQKWLPRTHKNEDGLSGSSADAIELGQIGWAFLLIGTALVAALIWLVAEKLFHFKESKVEINMNLTTKIYDKMKSNFNYDPPIIQ